MIYIKGIELNREDDKVVVGVTEEELAKSVLYYAVSEMGTNNLESILKGLLSGNKINLGVTVNDKHECSCGGNCHSQKKNNLEDNSIVLEDKSEDVFSFEDSIERVELSDVDIEMMKEALMEQEEIVLSVERLSKECPVVYSLITGSKNQLNKVFNSCDIKLQININNVTFSFVKNGKEDISPANNTIFYWDLVNEDALSEMFKLI